MQLSDDAKLINRLQFLHTMFDRILKNEDIESFLQRKEPVFKQKVFGFRFF